MSPSDDLPRLSNDHSDGSDELRELMRSARDDGPEAAQVDRLWKQLQPIAGGSGSGSPPDGGSSGPGVAAVGSAGASMARSFALGAGIAALVIATGTLWTSSGDMRHGAPPTDSSVRVGEASSVMVRVPYEAAPAASLEPVEVPKPRVRVAVNPTVEAPAVESEADLLQRAHQALRSGQAERALSMTSDHAKQHPRGVLSQERELIAVQALVDLGRRSEALARAESFLTRYPSSAHARRLRAVLGLSDTVVDAGSAGATNYPSAVINPEAGGHTPAEELDQGVPKR